MDASQLFEKLLTTLRPALDWSHAADRDEWDQQTSTPEAAHGDRGFMTGELRSTAHRQFTLDAVGDLLAQLMENLGRLPQLEATIVRRLDVSYQRARLVPIEFVARSSAAYSEANAQWRKAVKARDFTMFAPSLTNVIELTREHAGYLGADANEVDSVYTALLNGFEPGMTTERARELLSIVCDWTVPFLQRVAEAERDRKPARVLDGEFPVEDQRALVRTIVSELGFDFSRGGIAETHHPFCTSCGINDVRITTHLYPDNLARGLFAVIHEGGHGMFEQGMPLPVRRAKSGNMLYSLGIHESQSRLWENIVGRGMPFSRHALPLFAERFPETLKGVTVDDMHAAVNRIEPGCIRIFADEVTYNLHIVIRFELELALLSGDLAVKDLPEAWDEKYAQYLGVTPQSVDKGCLQDIHWSWGMFGYFPTYTFGNLLSAQLWERFVQERSWFEEAGPSEFRGLLDWLRENVHERGAVYSLDDLASYATGHTLDPRHWFDYVDAKFGTLSATR